jgi:putative DNA methylase
VVVDTFNPQEREGMMKALIEDYMPIAAVGTESTREKSLWRSHPFTSHLWWARRPLVACRAAVYGALVPASRFQPANGPEEKRESLARANAAKFVERLCKYPGNPDVIKEAQRHILEAHAQRLSEETGEPVTVEDIVEGRAPHPRVLDMFAGGGAIPLEALRLGCEAYALDLNPVAYIIELCTLEYPQKYGKPDPNARGMTGPKNARGETTWGGLANEVRYWGEWVLEKVKAEIGDLYPLIPDPEFKGRRPELQATLWHSAKKDSIPPGYVVPVAYLWTRTVRCKNPTCGATVPLVKQTWLCKKKGRYVALRVVAPKGKKQVRFDIVEATSERSLGFDPAAGSKGGNATCPFCGTVADIDHIKDEGWAGRIGQQLMAIVATDPARKGKLFVDSSSAFVPDEADLMKRIQNLCMRAGLTVPTESIANLADESRENSLGITVRPYGLRTFDSLFTHRQILCLLVLTAAVREVAHKAAIAEPDASRTNSIVTFLAAALDRQAENLSALCRWNANAEKMQGTFGRQVITMVWDFCEVSPFGGSVGDWQSLIDLQVNAIEGAASFEASPGCVARGSAMQLPWGERWFDAIVTDPPYYDNVPYADISDFFYVWLKRSIGNLYPEHFGSSNTPKKAEAIADPMRHAGDRDRARVAYERMMAQSFAEASRVLKPGAPMVVVYAHKTTLGWATLVDALRVAGFAVTEAWPLDTEMKSRLRGMESAALASSIFLVAHKRDAAATGSYEEEVRPELERVVRERVDSLWKMGITGADLVIAAVGAGLRAFTRFYRVEYANGEEVPAARFLAEVEGVVLETLLEKIFGMPGSGVAAVDGPSRFYVLWRYAYKAAEMEAGEAIVFTYGQNVELDGQKGLSTGRNALVEKKKGKYRLRDFTERGEDEKLGLLHEDGAPASLIDALHRILWLVENQPRNLNRFLDEARPDRERLRLIAQALAGKALAGTKDDGAEHTLATTAAEQAALKKVVGNWRALIEQRPAMPLFEGKEV